MWRKALAVVGVIVLLAAYLWVLSEEPVWFHVAFAIWLALMAYSAWLRRRRKTGRPERPSVWRATGHLVLGLVLLLGSWALALYIAMG